MSSITTESLLATLIVTAILTVVGVGAYVGYQYKSNSARADQAEREVATQSAVITKQAFEFNRFNQISQQASQYAISAQVKSDEQQIIIREVVKQDPAARQCVPNTNGIVDRLLQHKDSLRASAMYADTGKPDTTDTGTVTASCRLTYGQAVYWIDPLLTAIDQANSQLAGIRQIEETRQEKP